MTHGSLTWESLTTKAAARELQTFTCTTDPPRTPGRRRLEHPRGWEWEAQRHIRTAAHHLRPGDALLVGRDNGGEIAAAAHVDYDEDSGLLVAYINALGVAMSHRKQGGSVADEALRVVRQTACDEANGRWCSTLLLTGAIHRHNLASQYACLRAGMEPKGLPSGDYQLWALKVAL